MQTLGCLSLRKEWIREEGKSVCDTSLSFFDVVKKVLVRQKADRARRAKVVLSYLPRTARKPISIQQDLEDSGTGISVGTLDQDYSRRQLSVLQFESHHEI